MGNLCSPNPVSVEPSGGGGRKVATANSISIANISQTKKKSQVSISFDPKNFAIVNPGKFEDFYDII